MNYCFKEIIWYDRPGSNRVRNPKRQPGEQYSVESYRQAIERACKKASVPHWHPHQLRHNAATFLRKEFGLEAARIILGHKSAAITEIYAELDREKAIEVICSGGYSESGSLLAEAPTGSGCSPP